MAEITAALVKDLRTRSGAGMMDCKKALTETNGDIEAAVDWLRTKGLAAAAKKIGRVAAEGLVAIATHATRGAVVEVNSETDFVARNAQFQEFVAVVAQLALAQNTGDIAALAEAAYPNTSPNSVSSDATVSDQLTQNIATIGEQQSLRRAAILSVSTGLVAGYVHNAVASPSSPLGADGAGDVQLGLGKIAVLVGLESTADADSLIALGKHLAMHIAAASPLALKGEDLDPALVARERAIAEEKAVAAGKPADLIGRIADGTISKFRKENALLSQLFVMDNKTPVAEVVAAAGKDIGAEVILTGFVRFQLGEGIAKAASDFAAEVAATAGIAKDGDR